LIAPPSTGLGVSESSSVVSEVFIAEELDGVQDEQSGNTTVFNVETPQWLM